MQQILFFSLITVLLLFCTRSSVKFANMNLLRAFYYEFIFSHLACSPHKFPFAFQLQQDQLADNTIDMRLYTCYKYNISTRFIWLYRCASILRATRLQQRQQMPPLPRRRRARRRSQPSSRRDLPPSKRILIRWTA